MANNGNYDASNSDKSARVNGALYTIEGKDEHKVVQIYYNGIATTAEGAPPYIKNKGTPKEEKIPAIHDQLVRRADEELNGTLKRGGIVYKQAKVLQAAQERGLSLELIDAYYTKGVFTKGTVELLENVLTARVKVAHPKAIVYGGNFCRGDGMEIEVAKELLKQSGKMLSESIIQIPVESLQKDLDNQKRYHKRNRISAKDQQVLPKSHMDMLYMMFENDPYDLYQQSNMQRWNCVETIKRQNLAEHHCYTAQILIKIFEFVETFGGKIPEHSKLLALMGASMHDLGELRFGDMNIMLKMEYPELSEISNKVEHETIKSFIGYRKPFEEVQKDELARILYKLADHIDMHLFLLRENTLGNKNKEIDAIWRSTQETIKESYAKLLEMV